LSFFVSIIINFLICLYILLIPVIYINNITGNCTSIDHINIHNCIEKENKYILTISHYINNILLILCVYGVYIKNDILIYIYIIFEIYNIMFIKISIIDVLISINIGLGIKYIYILFFYYIIILKSYTIHLGYSHITHESSLLKRVNNIFLMKK